MFAGEVSICGRWEEGEREELTADCVSCLEREKEVRWRKWIEKRKGTNQTECYRTPKNELFERGGIVKVISHLLL